MIVVVEGPDGSGKSVLVEKIARYINWRILHSSGPDRDAQAWRERVIMYLGLTETICDRHPAVSERIYGKVRGNYWMKPDLLLLYQETKKFTIYCSQQFDHRPRKEEPASHLNMIARHTDQIRYLYDRWAIEEADYIYRGENVIPLLRAVEGAIRQDG